MGNQVIHIYGAAGSGTSTLGKYISDRFGYYFMDTDDYFWLPTNPPFTTKRARQERLDRMKQEIATWNKVVISGSLVDWGDELIPLFTLVIRINTDTMLRIERIKKRERERFGSRIDPDGDLYENHCRFLEWAASYDTGDLNMRSKAEHDEWQKLLQCKQIELDGSKPVEDNFKIVQSYLCK